MALISPEYLALQKQMHENPDYGTAGAGNLDMVRKVSAWGRKRILDYGAGKQAMAFALGPAYRVTPYDPCVEGIDTPPEPHPVVICGDVLEHIEPECLDDVLRDIRRVTQQTALFLISTQPAEKNLPDGRNAHLIVQDKEWWKERIQAADFHITLDGDGTTPSGKVVGYFAEALPC